jgi:hypothetical protein
MRRALVGSDRLGSGCLVLRADTRENPGGKNGVMTPALGVRISSTFYHRNARKFKRYKDKRDGEIKSLIKAERSHITFAIFGISYDGNRDICT